MRLALPLRVTATPAILAPPPLRHEAQIWQRRWTPARKAAIAPSESHLQRSSLLAAEIESGGSIVPAVGGSPPASPKS